MSLINPTAQQKKSLERWRLSTFWVMLIGYIGYYIGRGNLPVALPLLSKEFGYSNTDLGIILTLSELAYALGKFTTGPLADKVGGKLIFIIGLVGAIVFNLLFPLFSSIFMFTVIWCFCRYFLSMGWGGIIKTIGEWYEPERNGTIMGIISINFQFGSVFASLFCSFLLMLGFGWKALFYYPAMVMILVVIWAYFSSKESPHDLIPNVRFGRYAGHKDSLAHFKEAHGKRSAREILRGLLKIRMFRQILVFSFFTHLLRSIFLFWTPKFMVDMGMGQVAAAMTSAIFPLLGCLGTLFLGWYTDRHAKDGDRARMMWKMLVGLVISLVIVAALVPFKLEYQYALVGFLGLAGFCLYGPYSMSSGCLTLDIAGSEAAGTCTGMIDGVGYIGGALAAWGAGYLSDSLGWSQVFYVLAGFAVLSVLSAYVMSRAYQQDLKGEKV
ncbi:MAG TPA: MFS transporter [Pseudobdellovibrionaceae bacterium]|jgi:sugar phosphate permease